MTTRAEATFATTSWDEQPLDDAGDGRKLTRALNTYAYAGDIEGTSTLEYVMMYREDGTGTFVGLERITGSVGGRSGSVVMEHRGTFEGEGVSGRVSVVAGSGTGDLASLRGEGRYDLAGQAERYPITLDYDLE